MSCNETVTWSSKQWTSSNNKCYNKYIWLTSKNCRHSISDVSKKKQNQLQTPVGWASVAMKHPSYLHKDVSWMSRLLLWLGAAILLESGVSFTIFFFPLSLIFNMLCLRFAVCKPWCFLHSNKLICNTNINMY